MSQTETLMLVALGFVAASFVALVLGRVLWKLARPLSPTLTPEMLTSQERLTRHIEDLTALSQEIASQREQFAEERDRLSALRQAIAVSAPPAVDDAVEVAEPRQEIDAIDEHGR